MTSWVKSVRTDGVQDLLFAHKRMIACEGIAAPKGNKQYRSNEAVASQRRFFRLAQSQWQSIVGIHPQLQSSYEQQKREGFGWRFHGVRDWTTEAIFERLVRLGVTTSPEFFLSEVRRLRSPGRLAEFWKSQVGKSEDTRWQDFPPVVCEELWRRLTPDQACVEMYLLALEDCFLELSAATKRGEVTRPGEALDAARPLLNHLTSVPPAERRATWNEASDLAALDLGDALRVALQTAPAECYAECMEIAEALRAITGDRCFRDTGLLAMADGSPEEADEALRRAQQLSEAEGERSETWMLLGDLRRSRGEWDEALECYGHATIVTDSLTMVKEANMRMYQLLDCIIAEDGPYVAQWCGEVARTMSETTMAATGQLKYGPPPELAPPKLYRAGRNDPCPCGSGRKHKHCCGKKGARPQ